MAMCSMPCSGVAPCQCFSPGGIHTVSPARTGRIGPPQVCTWPMPEVMCNVCPSGWVCQAVRAPGSKRTQAERKSAGSGVWMIGSCHTVPVKLGALMRRDGRDPQAIMSMVIPSPYCIRIRSSFLRWLCLARSPRMQKARRRRRAFVSVKSFFRLGAVLKEASGRLQIASRLLATLGDDLVADLLALDQRTHAGLLDRGDVHEHILGVVIRLNKAEAFLGIEELHSSSRHRSSFHASR